jgi:Fe-S cluster assembly scaffold protein SufB
MLDKEAIFYMRSRGISEKTAQNLLLQAFIDEVADTISTEKDYNDYIKEVVANKLGMA